MLLIPGSVRIYIARDPVDMRRSFEGLSNHVKYVLGRDPLAGHVFVFLNRSRTHAKLLVWTRGGFTIVYKRLEAGTFALPSGVASAQGVVEVDVHELAMLLEGIDLERGLVHRRWAPKHRASDDARRADGMV